jgi:hypothetical protein
MPSSAFEGSGGGDVAMAQCEKYGLPVLDAIFDASRKAEECARTSTSSTPAASPSRPSRAMGVGGCGVEAETETTPHPIPRLLVLRDGDAAAAKVITTCASLERLALDSSSAAAELPSAELVAPPTPTPPSSRGAPNPMNDNRGGEVPGGGDHHNRGGGGDREEGDEGRETFVGGVPYGVTEAALVELLSQYGGGFLLLTLTPFTVVSSTSHPWELLLLTPAPLL